LLDPAMAPFYGCTAMALLSVGAGTMLVGKNVVGESAALAANAALWSAGTVLGLLVAIAVLVLMITKYDLPVGSAAPTWLLAVVSPMVSAATGALLVPHLPAGQARGTMLLACYSMFGISLIATLVILPSVFAKLVHHKIGPIQTTPALWLVLGPLGQSVTAVNQLADAGQGAVRGEYHQALEMFALIYGVPVLGFALLWLAIAGCITLRAFQQRMPFTLTWWAFTFPVGTCVTGAAGLAKHTGLNAYAWVATALFLLLLSTWAMVATRTAHGVLKGNLLIPRPSN
jgi:tellurite resistance protein TehA-like permease